MGIISAMLTVTDGRKKKLQIREINIPTSSPVHLAQMGNFLP